MQEEKPATQSRVSFVERRIEDAKKLFESRMQGSGTSLFSSTMALKEQHYSGQGISGLGPRPEASGTQAKMSGQSPLPSHAPPAQPIPMPQDLNIPMPPQQQPASQHQSQRPPFGQGPAQQWQRPPLHRAPQQQHLSLASQQQQQDAIYPDPEEQEGGIFDRPMGQALSRDAGKNKPILPRVLSTKNHPSRGGGGEASHQPRR